MARNVPETLIHCTVALRKRGKSAKEAFEICKRRLQQYGYLRKGSIVPTPKGRKRDLVHRREPMAARKRREFDKMANEIFGDVK